MTRGAPPPDPILTLAHRQAEEVARLQEAQEGAQEQAGPPGVSALGQREPGLEGAPVRAQVSAISIVFDDVPPPPRREAEVPPPDPALLREQLQADLLKEQLEQQQIETVDQRNRSRFLREEQNHIREYRRKYSGRVFTLTSAWLVFTAALIVATGFRNSVFGLSDAVLVAALGSALAGVIGMFLVILNWLYPRPEREKEGK